jgi:diadenosine tetraphosphate (Ap4A) HIT family hydrolase
MIQDLDLQIEATCRFCNPPEKERILYESDNFYVMLSLGPIVEGYALLVSKQHIGCCAEIPEELSFEFESLYTKIRSLLVSEYGSCISYEHGKAGSCLVPTEGSKHCFHSHMHFVPVNIQLNEIVQKDFSKYVELSDLRDFGKSYNAYKSPYLYVDDGRKIMYIDVYDVRSQYLRYNTAIATNNDKLWDWVKYQGWEKVNSGISRLKGKIV